MLTPVRDNVIVEKVEAAKQTAGGILLPEKQRVRDDIDLTHYGKVMAVGEGTLHVVPSQDGHSIFIAPLTVREGDTVIFRQTGGYHVEIDRKDYIILEWKDVLAKV